MLLRMQSHGMNLGDFNDLMLSENDAKLEFKNGTSDPLFLPKISTTTCVYVNFMVYIFKMPSMLLSCLNTRN
jgi:hypothetical protein